MTIRHRLALAFVLCMSLLGLANVLSLRSAGFLQHEIEDLVDNRLERIDALRGLEAESTRALAEAFSLLQLAQSSEISDLADHDDDGAAEVDEPEEAAARHEGADHREEIEEELEELREAGDAMLTYVDSYASRAAEADGQARQLKAEVVRFMAVLGRVVLLAGGPANLADAIEAMELLEEVEEHLLERIELVLSLEDEHLTEVNALAAREHASAVTASWLVFAAALAIAVCSWALVGRGILGPIRRLTASAEALSRGASWGDVGTNEPHEFAVLSRGFAEMDLRRKQYEASLHEARARAEAASHSKSEFLANMSHEIRTPMNGILGMGEMALQMDTTPEQRKCLEAMVECGMLLLDLINDILDLSKIEAGRVELELTPFDLVDCTENVASLLATKAADKGLELVCHVDARVPRSLNGDPTRFRQVLINLCGNAIKFTHAGEVVVSVVLVEDTDEHVTLDVSVRDTGVGIPADRQQAIFQTFTQADGSTTREYGGTGLGLSISRQLVELMGGELGVTSEPGHGSTFGFRVVLDKVVDAEQAGPAGADSALRGRRVLVLDDNRSARRSLREILGEFGCRAELVGGSAEALTALTAAREDGAPFEALLVDEGVFGDEPAAVQALRLDSPAAGHPEVVLLTLPGDLQRDRAADGLQAAGVVAKPVRRASLREALRAALCPDAVGEAAAEPDVAQRQGEPLDADVLLVEDNPVNIQLGKMLLERMGCTVTVAKNGRQALDTLAQGGFDVVLMDLQMPVMGGLEATRLIREREARSGGHVPIIAMTAHAMHDHRMECLDAGMDDYLAKPVRAAEVRAKVERFVTSHS